MMNDFQYLFFQHIMKDENFSSVHLR